MIKNTVLSLGCVLFGMVSFTAKAWHHDTVTIGTGSTVGVYYPTGGAICRILNRQNLSKSDAPLCVAESTSGSTQNAKGVSRKELDFAILQEDILADAYYGKGKKFLNKPRRDLRMLFRLYPETFTVLANKNTKIKSFIDLKGKDIGVGISGTGDYNNLRRYLNFQGTNIKDFANFFYSSSKAERRLCSDALDATVITMGHPNLFIRRSLEDCNGQLVGLSKKVIHKLTVNFPEYIKTTIYKGTYNNTENIHTFGVYAVLATHADAPNEVVYQITKAIFENLDILKSAHPVLNRMAFDNMINERSVIPIHPGAIRYFKETKLMNSVN